MFIGDALMLVISLGEAILLAGVITLAYVAKNKFLRFLPRRLKKIGGIFYYVYK